MLCAATTAAPACSAGVDMQTLLPPGASTALTVGAITTTSVALAWTPPTVAGDPPATTGAACVAAGAPCGAPRLGNAPDPAVGMTTATVTNLPSGTPVTCYAVAANSQGTACSDAVDVTTLAPPSLPRDVALAATPGQYDLAFTWLPPVSAGIPTAVLGVTCVAAGAPCTAPPAGAGPTPAVGLTAGAVLGLTSNTTYSCYATASNAATPPSAPVCSPPLTATTAFNATRINVAPGPPAGVAAAPLSAAAVNVSWTPTFPGIPAATYDAVCVSQGQPCTAAPAGAGAAAGVTSATVDGLAVGTGYARAATVTPVCSAGVDVSTWTPPGAPTALALVSVNDTAVTLAWALPSPPGLPVAAIAATCVASGSPCTAAAVGVAPPPAAGATLALVTALPPRTALSCYAVATNPVPATVCSSPLSVTTWAAPGPATDVTAAPLTTQSVTVSWGAAAPPGEPLPTTYRPLCVAAGAPCSAAPVAVGAPSTTAPPASATVGGAAMAPLATYTCYVVTSNAVGPAAAACSAGADVTTYSLPVCVVGVGGGGGTPRSLRPTAPPPPRATLSLTLDIPHTQGRPPAPTITADNITATSITATWNATLTPPGSPPPTLGLTCRVGSNTPCTPPGDGTPTPPTVGATTGTVIGLSGATTYTCYVFAMTSATAPPTTRCSAPTVTRTWTAPSGLAAPTDVRLQWAQPTQIGTPATALGVARGAPCTAVRAGTVPPPAIGASLATVTGLAPASNFTCYTIATSIAVGAPVCSAAGLSVDTPSGSGAPTGLALTRAGVNELEFGWSLPATPPPGAEYALNCGPQGASCADVVALGLNTPTPISPGFPGRPPQQQPGLTAGTVTWLGAGTLYTCYAFENSTAASACSTA